MSTVRHGGGLVMVWCVVCRAKYVFSEILGKMDVPSVEKLKTWHHWIPRPSQTPQRLGFKRSPGRHRSWHHSQLEFYWKSLVGFEKVYVKSIPKNANELGAFSQKKEKTIPGAARLVSGFGSCLQLGLNAKDRKLIKKNIIFLKRYDSFEFLILKNNCAVQIVFVWFCFHCKQLFAEILCFCA